MDKGTRIKIITGTGEGTSGSVFWTGPDKFRGGLRLGVRGDDGETYWVSEADVEASEAPPPAGPTFDKGDRVRFRSQGEEGTGTVFWTGESRNSAGQRLGIRDDQDPEEAIWIDSRFAAPLPPEEDSGPPPAGAPSRPRQAAPAASTSSSPARPPDDLPPPMDDSAIDSLAAWNDEDGGGGDDDDMPW